MVRTGETVFIFSTEGSRVNHIGVPLHANEPFDHASRSVLINTTPRLLRRKRRLPIPHPTHAPPRPTMRPTTSKHARILKAVGRQIRTHG